MAIGRQFYADGAFTRKCYTLDGKIGCLYVPEEMKKNVSEEKLTDIFKELLEKWIVTAYWIAGESVNREFSTPKGPASASPTVSTTVSEDSSTFPIN